MHARNLRLSGLGLVFLGSLAILLGETRSAAPEDQQVRTDASGQPVLSGPYVHENLAVYLIHGVDRLKGRDFLTLKEALEQKKIRVDETGHVNELTVENLSEKDEIFVQAGEIVRGGKQDRVLGLDLIIGPRSGKIPIGAFCVEHGRWQRRGTESVAFFGRSDNLVSSNKMKIAIVRDRSQGEVWSNVSGVQQRLSASLGTPVAHRASEPSLELSLENEKLRSTVDPYVSSVAKAIEGKDDAIGLVVLINGKLYSADLYGSPKLFRKLWSKLLEASANEAVASRNDPKASVLATFADVRAFFAAAEDATAVTKGVSSHTRMVTRETTGCLMTESFDTKSPQTWVHRNYIRKPAP
jgi:uncharacterized protein YjeT (DUF2065 family)